MHAKDDSGLQDVVSLYQSPVLSDSVPPFTLHVPFADFVLFAEFPGSPDQADFARAGALLLNLENSGPVTLEVAASSFLLVPEPSASFLILLGVSLMHDSEDSSAILTTSAMMLAGASASEVTLPKSVSV